MDQAREAEHAEQAARKSAARTPRACNDRRARVNVEADGLTHSSDEEFRHDRRRDSYLKTQGWRVVHVWNEEVYRKLESVLYAIEGALTSKHWDG